MYLKPIGWIRAYKVLGIEQLEEDEESGRNKRLSNASKVLREKAGMSQQELADAAEISKITVQRIENAKYSVTIDTLISIPSALNIPLKRLVDF